MEKQRDTIIIIITILLIAGVIAGSIYMNNISVQMGEGIASYLSSFLNNMQQNTDSFLIFKNSFKNNIITALIIFASGFFKLGVGVTAAMIIRKGFIVGFTAASFIKFYGIKGILVMLSMIPSIIIIIPALLLFASVSLDFSFNTQNRQKKSVGLYCLFAAITILIFCLSSLAEGYITTFLIHFAAPRII